MSFHDPIRQSKYLRQTLPQDKKPIGFFVFAECQLAVNMPEGQWPLISDVAGLTKYVKEEINKEIDTKEGLLPIINSQKGNYSNMAIACMPARDIALNAKQIELDKDLLVILINRLIKDINEITTSKYLLFS
ncbi:hypothetical protein [Sphingobacterium paucimobilis]|uniref:Uncharacterized protein n=1 Tax=Sphingobacterium paucimobilis HER1398 TaxID=1346330 RepID=U2HPD7_9SPHI|nr:hypothetical protein [Sphingobacterium paucimobilis]ERJ57150.1 hypothetical protein M472_00075 [Sphingobacterium paucimobilis HER1398]